MDLVERTEQEIDLKHLLTECENGKGAVVLLDGPGGSGRTELQHRAAQYARQRGGLVLRAGCSRVESALPYGVLGQLLGSLPAAGELISRLQKMSRAEATDTVSARDTDSTGTALAPELALLLAEVAQLILEPANDSLVFLGIDDIRHADAPSLDCLLYLVRRTGAARVVVVLTDDAAERTGRSHFRAELLDLPHTHHVPLTPLTEAQVAAVLAAQLGEDEGERLAPEFHAVSGGSLRLLGALTEDHEACGGVRREGYGRAVLHQLARLDEPVADVARALAVLGSAEAPERLDRIAGTEHGTAESALRTLRAVGLVDGMVLRHDVARQVILDDLPADERTALRLGAAKLLYEQGTPSQDIAPLLIEADQPSGDWSVDVLLEAAEQDLLADRTHRSVAALEAALRARPDGQTGPTVQASHAAIESRLVQVRRLFDPAAAEHHLTALTTAARTGELDPAHTIDLVRQLLWQGRTVEAGELLERLRGTSLEPHSEVAALLEDTESWLAWTHPTLAQRTNRPRRPATGDAQHPGSRRTEPWCRPTALLAEALVNGRAHQVVDQARQVLKDRGPSYDISWPEEPALLALGVLLSTDAQDATAWCDRLLREGHTPYSPTWMGLLSATRSEAALRQGDLTGAVEHAHQALNHVTPNAWGVAVGAPLGSLILATTRMGHYEEAGSYLTRAVPQALFDTRYGLHYLHARGQCHLATGHHHAALADFLACGDRMRAWGIDVPGIVPWRSSAAEAWLALGNREQASRLAYDQLGRPGTHGARARAAALRVLAVSGPTTRRPQMLTEALDLYERCGDRYEQIRVLADLGEAHHELGDNRRARTHIRRARHLVGLCGAAPLSDGLLSFPDDAEEQSATPAGDRPVLTGSEHRVAALAVGGYTNREISAKLFITPSTVEQHLTRVYRKLGVRRRKDLPVELSTSGIEAVAGLGA